MILDFLKYLVVAVAHYHKGDNQVDSSVEAGMNVLQALLRRRRTTLGCSCLEACFRETDDGRGRQVEENGPRPSDDDHKDDFPGRHRSREGLSDRDVLVDADPHERVHGEHESEADGEAVEEAEGVREDPLAADDGDERDGHVEHRHQDVGDGQVGQQEVGARAHAAVPQDRQDHHDVPAERQHHRHRQEEGQRRHHAHVVARVDAARGGASSPSAHASGDVHRRPVHERRGQDLQAQVPDVLLRQGVVHLADSTADDEEGGDGGGGDETVTLGLRALGGAVQGSGHGSQMPLV